MKNIQSILLLFPLLCCSLGFAGNSLLGSPMELPEIPVEAYPVALTLMGGLGFWIRRHFR